MLERHAAKIVQGARWNHRGPAGSGRQWPLLCAAGACRDRLAAQLEREVFGPVLHIVQLCRRGSRCILGQINASGYGLTLGVHSRIDSVARHVAARVRVGNIYVNRNMIGAVVGVQPFGGCGLSGTGPKAGGPHYLARFATEQTVTVNTAAVGGNASLLSLGED